MHMITQAHNFPSVGWSRLSLEDALVSLKAGTLPLVTVDDCACILKRCRKERDPVFALRLHAYMTKNGLDTCLSLGNDLISVLAEIGYLQDARKVFEKLSRPYQGSWNCLLAGYIKHGDAQQAFILYEKMRLDTTLWLSSTTAVALLRFCAQLQDLSRGRQVHSDIVNWEFLIKDAYVGSALVDMYAKCGSLTEAHRALDMLPIRGTVSWTALISAYAEHGFNVHALDCLEQMQHEGVLPDTVTYACSLKACTSLRAIERGEKMHVELSRNGLQKHHLIGNSLIDMYAKFGFLVKAQEVFDNMDFRTAVSWTALISAYADHGRCKEALNWFKEMRRVGMSPDFITYICSLKACISMGASIEGQEIHTEIIKRGLESKFIFATLVDMYSKIGWLAEAHDLLNRLVVRDVVLWTALIAGYVEHGHSDAALGCYEQMQEEGISPDAVTFACSLKACGSTGAADKGQEIHNEVMERGLGKDHFVGNSLIDMYSKCGLLLKAEEVFYSIVNKDVASWTALMTGFVEHGRFCEALEVFDKMHNEGISSDAVSFVCSLKASGGMRAADKGEQIYGELVLKGLEGDPSVCSSLVDMYGKCGLLVEAQEVFDTLPDQTVVAWNALIGGYVEHGYGEIALSCFDRMQRERVSLHAVTFLCTLKACSIVGALDTGQDIHDKIVVHGLETDSIIGNTLADLYAKCGLLAEAQVVFDKLVLQDDVSWNTLISGYSQLGESEAVFWLFEKMVESDVKPTIITFTSVLTVCSNAGLLDEGCMYFQAMKGTYDIHPSQEHYSCIVDLLGRLGRIDTAVALIRKLPFLPGLVVWHSVLGACRKSSNLDVGKQAFENAMLLDETDVSSYISMSNIYMDAG